jgi:ComF family protein
VDVDQMKCFDCAKEDHMYVEGGSLWVYEGLVKQAIYDYKYKGKKEYGVLFAKEVVRYYNETKEWSVDMVIPVPLYKKRLKERGFNQAEVIASILSKELGLKPSSDKALRRLKPTIPQKDLSDTDRRMNVHNAFCADGSWVKGQRILLIDDIYTTGSTINACTKALLEVGAKEVYYMAIAIGRGF